MNIAVQHGDVLYGPFDSEAQAESWADVELTDEYKLIPLTPPRYPDPFKNS